MPVFLSRGREGAGLARSGGRPRVGLAVRPPAPRQGYFTREIFFVTVPTSVTIRKK